MKTTIISVTNGSTSGVLKAIRENNIQHTYFGIDQNNQLLMQLSYDEENKAIIEGIHCYMKDMEILINEISNITSPLMEQIKKEQAKLTEEFKERQRQNTKKRKERKIIKQTETTNT